MNKAIIKATVLVVALIIIGGTVIFTGLKLRQNAEAHRPKAGFINILANHDICAIASDGKSIYAAGAEGIFQVNPDTLATEALGGFTYVRCLYADDSGLWAGTDSGLYHLLDHQISRYTTRDGLPDNRVLAITAGENGKLWLGTWGGAVEVALSETGALQVLTTYTGANGLLTDNVNVIGADDSGGMWFGSYVAPRGGVSVRLSDGSWQYFTTENGLLHSNITGMIKRQDGSMVVGAGLYHYGGATILTRGEKQWQVAKNLTKTEGLAGEKVRSLYEDRQGRLWIGSEYDGLVISVGENMITLTAATGLAHNEVKVITTDQNGNYWIGTLNGLTRIDGGII